MRSRKKRTEILSFVDVKELKKMADMIEEKNKVELLEKPNSGLVMVKMRESAKKNLFYLGEVFITECKVAINDVIGLGIVKGSHLKKAYYLAVIDAAYNSKIEEISILEKIIDDQEKLVELQRDKEAVRLSKTKVDFETLDEEVKA
jgi:alpha-D-ribose 1-methylphosphonate 5-triphosphate synthase subunit PhnG